MLLKEYLITSPRSLSASIKVGFDFETELLVSITFENLPERGLINFFKNWPITIDRLNERAEANKWSLHAVETDLSFANFYETYNVKRNKKRAEARWKRCTKDEKIKAMLYIKLYKNNLKLSPGQQPLYPESYLNAEPWND